MYQFFFLISQPPKTYVKIDGHENIYNCIAEYVVYLNLWEALPCGPLHDNTEVQYRIKKQKERVPQSNTTKHCHIVAVPSSLKTILEGQ